MRRALAMLAAGEGSDGVALVSRYGYACFGAEADVPLIRVAQEPLGGLRLRPASVYAPPADVGDGDAERILSAYLTVVDQRDGFAGDGSAPFPAPALLRRPATAQDPPPGMALAFLDEAGGDAVYRRDDLNFGDAAVGLDPATSDFIDEFAAFPIDRRQGTTIVKRFACNEMEIAVAPCACLSDPSSDQIGSALTNGRAVGDGEGRLRLAAPAFANTGGAFRIEISSIEAPVVKGGAGCGDVVARSASGGHLVEGTIAPGREAGLLEIHSASPAEVTAIWVAVTRRKGRWEVWDEADAQLQLEESW
ncbi:MAG: hypothetical protein AAFN79_06460 [Pseudomonadota bacterium]